MTDRAFVFGVDLDGVVADFYGGLRPIAAEWLGVALDSLPERVSWGLAEWGVAQAPGGYDALHKFAVMQRELFLKLPPTARAPQALRKLVESRRADSHHHASAVHQILPPDRREPDDPVARPARYSVLGPVLHAGEDGRRRRSVHRRLAVEHRAAAGRGSEDDRLHELDERASAGPRAGTWDEVAEMVLAEKLEWEREISELP